MNPKIPNLRNQTNHQLYKESKLQVYKGTPTSTVRWNAFLKPSLTSIVRGSGSRFSPLK